MKIRDGFVSNSSSTAFTFIFKGNPKVDLPALILKYRKHFDLVYDEEEGWVCSPTEVADALEKQLNEPYEEYRDHPKVQTVDEVIRETERSIESWKKYREENGNEDGWYNSWIDEETEHKEKLEKAKERGLDIVVLAWFGDHDGPWAYTGLGYAMDYEGRYIDIDEEDFVVFTEQNR